MDEAEFARVAASFASFHAQFAPLFGRKEAQAHSEQYVRGLLVQQTDRRNAENVAEVLTGVSARALQRFSDQRAVGTRARDGPPAGVSRAAAEHAGGGLDHRRERRGQAGAALGGGGPPVLWARGQAGQLPGGRGAWPTPRPAATPWSTRSSTCRRSGRTTGRAAGRRGCPTASPLPPKRRSG